MPILHSLAMQVALMIVLLFWRNLFTVGKNVTKHFTPEFSGGLTVEAMSLELIDEALLKRGLTSKVRLIVDQRTGF